MLIALSGTPGTGKTTTAHHITQQGLQVLDINDLAISNKFILGIDKKRHSTIIDITKINTYLKKHITTTDNIVIEGHTTHLLTIVEKVILLRCHPTILLQRLKTKGWTTEKIKENLEAETIDVILCETIEHHQKSAIFEIDTTKKTPKQVTQSILEIIQSNFKPQPQYTIGNIDWSEEILKDYPLEEKTRNGPR